MSAPPYMKLYVADYLGDTHHLSVVEHGAYLLLLMAMWRAGGTLPAKDLNLSKLARCTPDQWAEIRGVVLPFFKRCGGRITHKRLAEEIAKYETTSEVRAAAGKRGGRKKQSEINANSEAIALQTESISRHNQNQNQNQNIDAADDSACAPAVATSKVRWPLSDPPDGAHLDALSRLLREAAGVSLNDTSTKLFVLAPILGLGRGGNGPPADLDADVLPAIRSCAARAPPKSVNRWDYFVPAICEARDRRLSGAPATEPRHERPHQDAKFDARQANLARALAGSERAARRDWQP